MKEFVCIICPRGCNLKIDENLNVSGNSCKRGLEYAISEVTNPVRSITTTVKINSNSIKRLPVKSSNPLPKEKIFAIMKYLDNVEVQAPILMHEIVVRNIFDTGVDIISTREVKD